jgi:hypothetical protein
MFANFFAKMFGLFLLYLTYICLHSAAETQQTDMFVAFTFFAIGTFIGAMVVFDSIRNPRRSHRRPSGAVGVAGNYHSAGNL